MTRSHEADVVADAEARARASAPTSAEAHAGAAEAHAGAPAGAVTGRPAARPRFGARWVAACAARGPLGVGIDPHPSLLRQWGLPVDADGVERFARTTVEAIGDLVAVLKPQSAFFEAHGSRGVAALERVLADASAAGALVLLDVKRGDIGSTMAAYAQAYLADGSPLAADAITVSPYLGFESLRPALDTAAATGRGVFVLARTSNPEGADVQLAARDDVSVAQAVTDAAAAENAGMAPLGDVGLVIGATHDHRLRLDSLNGPVLAPGVGAQGATVTHVGALFGSGPAVVPCTSRDVLRHGPDQHAMRRAVAALIAELAPVKDTGDPVC